MGRGPTPSHNGSMNLEFPIRSDRLRMQASVKAPVVSEKTAFQNVDIVDTDAFGRTLLLDGHIQLTAFDERAYHEALVQIPLLNLPGARSALVVGGGDGGVIRELCRHVDMEHIDMVEIDEGVVRLCREHMPSLSAGAFEDPRVHLHIADAFPFVKKPPRTYDLIVVDSTDVYEEEQGELSEMLFTDAFYQDVRNCLNPGGVVVTQADNLVFCPYSLEEIRALYGRVFSRTGWYQALVPSFGGYSGYCWGSMDAELGPDVDIPANLGLAYLNPATLRLAFTPLRFS